ncbi:TetR/AcrR family transcriptional regulator [Bifidobacterium callitrichos]|uniref:TetR family transcriptional regulator n=1 Tax=Bifidobacterium callitrichos DSM 23973 TaxID=1437609 RepID=A0A087AD49_9BIFI|nr:TetR/AcrR family transcriptional regulator [Bifidobacterium callitrichos]KFI56699.1 TetR family transcriptional regulator [Bifidobacterium callitrichos DSM 23973]
MPSTTHTPVSASTPAKRNTKTEAKIKAAFTTLMQAKGFDAMTVSDIARTAGINRGTFYMHYLDKMDLRQQLVDDAIEDLTRILVTDAAAPDRTPDRRAVSPGGNTIASHRGKAICDAFQPASIADALRYIRDDYAFFSVVSRSGNDMQLYDRMKEVLKRLIVAQATRFGAEPKTDYNGIPADYAMEILVSAVSSIIWLWIRRGCKESPEEICRIIEVNKTTAPVDILW